MRIVGNVFDNKLGKQVEHLPNLKVAIRKEVQMALNGRMVVTEKVVRSIVDAECGYINTTHPDFPSGEKVRSSACTCVCVWVCV